MVVPLHSILKHQQKKDKPAANGSSSSSTDGKPSKSSSGGGGKAASSSSKSGSGGRAGKGRGVQPVVVPDGCLEGTRLTLVNVPNQPDAVEFSIRCVRHQSKEKGPRPPWRLTGGFGVGGRGGQGVQLMLGPGLVSHCFSCVVEQQPGGGRSASHTDAEQR